MIDPKQQDLNDVPECLRTLAEAVETDAAMAKASAVVILRMGNGLSVFGYGRGEEFAVQAFADCHLGAARLAEIMRPTEL